MYFKVAFLLISVTNKKMAKTNPSFLKSLNIRLYNNYFLKIILLGSDLIDFFFFFLMTLIALHLLIRIMHLAFFFLLLFGFFEALSHIYLVIKRYFFLFFKFVNTFIIKKILILTILIKSNEKYL